MLRKKSDFKSLFAVVIIFFGSLVMNAQSTSNVVFVNTNSVNVREKPAVNSRAFGTANKYDAFAIANVSCPSEWTPVKFSYYDNKKNDDVSTIAYINSKYTTKLENYPIQKELLNNQDLPLAADPSNDLSGSLSFNFDGNNFKADYRTVIISWVKEGGSGTADWAQISGKWEKPGYLIVTESNRQYDMVNAQDKIVVYDKTKGLLYFGGLLWKTPKNKKLPSAHITPEFIDKIKKYDFLSPFNNGLARVESNGKWGFINQLGDLVIPVKYNNAEDFSDNGLAAVFQNGKWGFINETGETVIPFKWDGICPIGEKSIVREGFWGFKDNYAIVLSGDKYGVINEKGDLVFPFTSYLINDFVNGYAILEQRNKDLYGVAGKNGKILIPVNTPGEMASQPFYFENGKLVDPKSGNFIDTNGRKIPIKEVKNNQVTEEENNIQEEDNFYSPDHKLGPDFFTSKIAPGFFAFSKDEIDVFGFIDEKGNVLLPPVFTFPMNEFGCIDNDYFDLNQGDIIGVYLNFETDRHWDWESTENPDIKSGYVDTKGNTTFTSQEIERAKKAASIRHKKWKEKILLNEY